MASTIADLPDGVAAQALDRLPIARVPYGAGDNRHLTPQHLKDFVSFAPDLLTGDRTYYVRNTGGSDSNNGLSSSTPFATFNKFLSLLSKFDMGGITGPYFVTCNIYPGTYNELIIMPHNPRLKYQGIHIQAVDTSWNPLSIPGDPTTVVFKPTTPGNAVLYQNYSLGTSWYNITFDASDAGFHQSGTAFKPCFRTDGGTSYSDSDFLSCRFVMPDNAAGCYVIEGAGEIGTSTIRFKMNGTYAGVFNGSHFGSGGQTRLEQVAAVDATVNFTDAFFVGDMYLAQFTQSFNQFLGWSNTTGRKYRGSFTNVWPNIIDVIPGNLPGIVTQRDIWLPYQRVETSPGTYSTIFAPYVLGSDESAGIPKGVIAFTKGDLVIPDTWGVFRDSTSEAARLSLNDAGTIKHLIFDGEDVIVDLDGRTISVGECGVTFSNEGASAIDPFILPAARAGLNYSFVVVNANGIRVTAVGDDTIRVGANVSAAAGKVEATAIGSVIKLIAVNATQWMAVQTVGTWTTT